MNFNEAYEQTIILMRANIPVALWGNPGGGKSALAQKVADDFNLELIDIRLGQVEPTDLNGFPEKDLVRGTFDYLPWEGFPLDTDPLPAGKAGWLILFDEINTAPRQNLAASYKIFLNRAVGSRKLHPNARLMAAGNLVGQGLAGALPSPLVSRLAHIQLDPLLVPEHKKIFGDSIYNFLAQHPNFVYAEPESANTPYPTLRTWEMLSQITDPSLVTASTVVGEAAAAEYLVHLQEEQQVIQVIYNSTEPFPMDRSGAILDYLKQDKKKLAQHITRFEGEWSILADLEMKAA